MVRVISGQAGGMKLKTVDSDLTKPTLDRVKEAMFSMVYRYFPCESVLDLFSGNGSLGIEALSRGAAFALFNDKSKNCCDIIRENLVHTGLSDRADIRSKDFSELIANLSREQKAFDLILLDPPYGKGLIGQSLTLLSKAGICGISDGDGYVSDCVAVAEHSVDDEVCDRYGDFEKIKCKKYGTVMVSLFVLKRDGK